MRACPPRVETEVHPEGEGSAVTVCVSQESTDPGGWVLDLYALFRDQNASRVFLGQVTLGAPNITTRRPSRIVMLASCPAAYRFALSVRGPTGTSNHLLVGMFVGNVTPLAFTPVNP